MSFCRGCLFAVSLVLAAGHVQAEYLGLPNGRSANPGIYPDLTVEVGLVSGDLGVQDYQNIAARVNYRLSDEMVLFGTFGISEFGPGDANPFGLGVLYFLPSQRIAPSLDIAAKASFHTGTYEVNTAELDVTVFAFEALISSPTAMVDNGLSWYGNFGIHRLGKDPGSIDFEFGFGGGVYLPVGSGEAYFGADVVDEITFGLGYRYFLQ